MAAKRDNFREVGRNVSYTLEGNTLMIAIPVDPATIKGSPLSSTGKSRLVGSTGGWSALADPKLAGLKLNVMISAPID